MMEGYVIKDIAGLIVPALAAGIKVPDDISNYDSSLFRHFSMLSSLNLNYRMPKPYVEWHNAFVIAKFTSEELNRITWTSLCAKGFIRGKYIG